MKRYINGIRRPFTKRGRWHMLYFVAIILSCLFFVRVFFLTQVEIPNDRKELGLLAGDRVIVNRWSYGFRLPFADQLGYHRWGNCRPALAEIVVYDYPDHSGRLGLDRVTALPGDTLWLDKINLLFTVVPPSSFGIGKVVVPETRILGRPVAVSFSVEEGQPFYRLLRPNRLFIAIE